jgi:transposase
MPRFNAIEYLWKIIKEQFKRSRLQCLVDEKDEDIG